jgi:hypothetical protein
MFTQRDPFDGGYGDVRDTGIQLRGNFGALAYRLGVFNGYGDRQNTLAVSDPKAVIGLLSYTAPAGSSLSGLTIGVSGATGNTGQSTGLIRTLPRTERDIKNAFIAYKRNKLSLQAEYLDGSAQGFRTVTHGHAARHRAWCRSSVTSEATMAASVICSRPRSKAYFATTIWTLIAI